MGNYLVDGAGKRMEWGVLEGRLRRKTVEVLFVDSEVDGNLHGELSRNFRFKFVARCFLVSKRFFLDLLV
jgi:hypothetical protein